VRFNYVCTADIPIEKGVVVVIVIVVALVFAVAAVGAVAAVVVMLFNRPLPWRI
jgi:hypothetical protein